MSADPTLRYIAALQAQIHAVLAPLVGTAPLSIVDFPDIRNVGDSAIWVGEIAYLRAQHQRLPSYVSAIRDFSATELEQLAPEGTLFVHGGGNFGDIWVAHQDFRERLMAQFPKRRIVQFAQSIHYGDPARVQATARAISRHGQFVLLVRDAPSLDFARRHFDCEVQLCPDMAFCIGAMAAPAPTLALLAMLREDKEKARATGDETLLDCPVEDWISEPRLPIALAKALGQLSALPTLDGQRMRLSKFNAAANQRLNRGTRQIGRAAAIVTDRLHVHILSLLLGRPHAVLDNAYGKIARFMDAFPGGTELTYRARSLTDAVDWARAQGRERIANAEQEALS
jgi:exopolysaccharide biosynthesis predicted pyruvyltransferase EpsI